MIRQALVAVDQTPYRKSLKAVCSKEYARGGCVKCIHNKKRMHQVSCLGVLCDIDAASSTPTCVEWAETRQF